MVGGNGSAKVYTLRMEWGMAPPPRLKDTGILSACKEEGSREGKDKCLIFGGGGGLSASA